MPPVEEWERIHFQHDGGLIVVAYEGRSAIYDPDDRESIKAASRQVHLRVETLETLGREVED